jgi:hypothetical protein
MIAPRLVFSAQEPVMAHFYFHIKGENCFVPDEEGSELPDIQAAGNEALNDARDLAIEALKKRQDVNGNRIEVATGDGEVVMAVPVRAVLIAH